MQDKLLIFSFLTAGSWAGLLVDVSATHFAFDPSRMLSIASFTFELGRYCSVSHLTVVSGRPFLTILGSCLYCLSFEKTSADSGMPTCTLVCVALLVRSVSGGRLPCSSGSAIGNYCHLCHAQSYCSTCPDTVKTACRPRTNASFISACFLRWLVTYCGSDLLRAVAYAKLCRFLAFNWVIEFSGSRRTLFAQVSLTLKGYYSELQVCTQPHFWRYLFALPSPLFGSVCFVHHMSF
jgi:hypothetical protein